MVNVFGAVKNAAGMALKFGSEKSPAILAGMAIAGVGVTVVSAIKAAPAYVDIIEDHQFELNAAEELHHNGANSDEEYKIARRKIHMAAVKKAAKILAPTFIAALFTIACIFSSHKIMSKRQAALAAAYTLLERDSGEYKKKVEELFGKKKADEVKQELAKDAVAQNPPPKPASEMPAAPGKIRYWIYLKPLQKYIWDDIENVNRAVNETNVERRLTGYSTVGQFLDFLCNDAVESSDLDELGGWDANTGDLYIKHADPIYVSWSNMAVVVLDFDLAIGDKFLGVQDHALGK